LVEEQGGLQRARKLLNQHSRGNAIRILKKFQDFLPCDSPTISKEQLFARYQESIHIQLAA